MGIYIQHKDTQFKVGDTVKVYQRIVEGGKERTQVFEGVVISSKGHAGEKTFTVRKISSGIGVERILPIDSPFIQKVEVVKKGIINRAKLYYLRKRTGRLALKVKIKYDTKEGNGKSAAGKPEETSTEPETDQETSPETDSGSVGGDADQEPAA